MIKPSVGRVVLYRPGMADNLVKHGLEPLAAIVACVHTDRMVNLVVFDANGHPHSKTSVALAQPGEPKPEGSFCHWMEYQIGQAAKAEALEARLAAK